MECEKYLVMKCKDFQSNRPQNESQIGPKNKNRINKNYVLI
jgi:hypothetical protein